MSKQWRTKQRRQLARWADRRVTQLFDYAFESFQREDYVRSAYLTGQASAIAEATFLGGRAAKALAPDFEAMDRVLAYRRGLRSGADALLAQGRELEVDVTSTVEKIYARLADLEQICDRMAPQEI